MNWLRRYLAKDVIWLGLRLQHTGLLMLGLRLRGGFDRG